jgi:hypothetical protein
MSDTTKAPDLSFLNCTICFELRPPPWRACINSHMLCDTCRSKLAKPNCPTCDVRIDGACLVRQHKTEEVVRVLKVNLVYPCRNEGCSISLPEDMLAAHASVCPFRQYVCPARELGYDECKTCKWTSRMELAPEHLYQCLKAQGVAIVSTELESGKAVPLIRGDQPTSIVSSAQRLYLRWVSWSGLDAARLSAWAFDAKPVELQVSISSKLADHSTLVHSAAAPLYSERNTRCRLLVPSDVIKYGDATVTVLFQEKPAVEKKRPLIDVDNPEPAPAAKAGRVDAAIAQ